MYGVIVYGEQLARKQFPYPMISSSRTVARMWQQYLTAQRRHLRWTTVCRWLVRVCRESV